MSTELGAVIAEQVQRVTLGQRVAWERVMRLHIKPRPRWLPDWCWRRVLATLLVQSETLPAPVDVPGDEAQQAATREGANWRRQ